MCATLDLAVVLYGEPFSWDYAFSDLGSTATWQGKVNAPARLVFTLGGLASSWVMLRIWAVYTGEPRFRNQKTKRALGALGTVGYLLSSVPNSQNHLLHTIGAILAFAVLVFFSMIFFFELRATIPRWRFVLELVLLQVVVFAYAVAFFADWSSKQGFQKACILVVFYTVLRAVSLGDERFVLREVFRDLGDFFS